MPEDEVEVADEAGAAMKVDCEQPNQGWTAVTLKERMACLRVFDSNGRTWRIQDQLCSFACLWKKQKKHEVACGNTPDLRKHAVTFLWRLSDLFSRFSLPMEAHFRGNFEMPKF